MVRKNRQRRTKRAYSSRWLAKVRLPVTSVLANGSSAPPVCSVTAFNVPTNVGACSKVVSGSLATVRKSFNMNADFDSATGYACEKCEYRQYIYGYFKARATSSDPWISYPSQVYGGGNLDGSFREDGCSGGAYRYGHRNEANHCAEDYLPTRATGCEYRGFDSPGMINFPVGWQYDFHLEFMGQIVNADTGNVILSNTWSAICSGTF